MRINTNELNYTIMRNNTPIIITKNELEKYAPSISYDVDNPESMPHKRLSTRKTKLTLSQIQQNISAIRKQLYRDDKKRALASMIALDKEKLSKNQFEQEFLAHLMMEAKKNTAAEQQKATGLDTKVDSDPYITYLTDILGELYTSDRGSASGARVNITVTVNSSTAPRDDFTPDLQSGCFNDGPISYYELNIEQCALGSNHTEALGVLQLARQASTGASAIHVQDEYQINPRCQETWSDNKVDYWIRAFEIMKKIGKNVAIPMGVASPTDISEKIRRVIHRVETIAAESHINDTPVLFQFEDEKSYYLEKNQATNENKPAPNFVAALDQYKNDPTLIRNIVPGSVCPISKQAIDHQKQGVVLAADGYLYFQKALNDWLLHASWSPMTGQAMAKRDFLEAEETSQLLKRLPLPSRHSSVEERLGHPPQAVTAETDNTTTTDKPSPPSQHKPSWTTAVNSKEIKDNRTSCLSITSKDNKTTWWSWLPFSSLSASIFTKAKPKTNKNTTEEDKNNPTQNR